VPHNHFPLSHLPQTASNVLIQYTFLAGVIYVGIDNWVERDRLGQCPVESNVQAILAVKAGCHIPITWESIRNLIN